MSGPPSDAAPRRIDEVDSLRTFAMTAVIAQHCHILPFGWMGVWLFFVISGFVVTASLLTRPAEAPGALLGHFYARRAARILPIYVAYVLIGFAVSGLTQGRLEWPQLASLLLFYNNFQSAFAVGVFRGFPVGHLWTISVEMQFYLVFGLAFAFLPRRALAGVLALFLVSAPAMRWLGGLWLQHAGFSDLRAAFAIYAFSPMHFDSFALGALLALGSARWRSPPRSVALLLAGSAVLAIYAAAYVSLDAIAHRQRGLAALRNVISGVVFGDGRQIWLYSALALLFVGVLAVTLGGAAPWSAITRSRTIQAIGRASYGGYVYHAVCVAETRTLLRGLIPVAAGMLGKLEFGLVVFAIALPATIALSMVSYRYVERPISSAVGRRLRRPDSQQVGEW